MKFNPITNQLFTDDGQFVKELRCHFRLNWNDFYPVEGAGERACSVCHHPVLDTAFYNDFDLLRQIRSAPDTCLKVDLEQTNLTVIPHVVLG